MISWTLPQDSAVVKASIGHPCQLTGQHLLPFTKKGDRALHSLQLKVIVVPILHHGLGEDSGDDVILMFGLGKWIVVCMSE